MALFIKLYTDIEVIKNRQEIDRTGKQHLILIIRIFLNSYFETKSILLKVHLFQAAITIFEKYKRASRTHGISTLSMFYHIICSNHH